MKYEVDIRLLSAESHSRCCANTRQSCRNRPSSQNSRTCSARRMPSRLQGSVPNCGEEWRSAECTFHCDENVNSAWISFLECLKKNVVSGDVRSCWRLGAVGTTAAESVAGGLEAAGLALDASGVGVVAGIKCFLFQPHTFTVLSALPVARRPSARAATQITQLLCPVRVTSTLHTPDPGELSFHTFTVLS